tara:strand:- start:21971 stop:22261 length:291 start_codon:yes stop_codon:yes gene_type:complete
MSLPSRMHFIKNGEVVHQIFVNCGWFFDKANLVDYILDAINDKSRVEQVDPKEVLKDVDYTHIVLYNHVIRKDMLQKHLFGDLTTEQFLETVIEEK